ncbi:MAG: LytTR family DNA-binding domain-containing protein [Bacteroidota bacterium]
MEIIKAVIIDDEVSARETLTALLERFFPHVQVVAQADSIEKGVQVIRENEKDLVFLDIEMPFGSSFDILEQLEDIDFEVIFITAHNQYAIEAFRFSAVDYLLKPVKIKDLKQALEKFEKRRTLVRDSNQRVKVLINNINNQVLKLVLPTIHGFNIVDISTILRCEGERNYTRFIFLNGDKMLVSKTMKEFEDLLSKHGFFRIHQSFLVNLAYVKKYNRGQGGEIVMSDGEIIPVSRSRKDDFLKIFI